MNAPIFHPESRTVDWSSHASPHTRREGPGPKPWVGDTLATFSGVGLGGTIALALSQESRSTLSSAAGILQAAGRLSGLVGTYLMLVMLVLIARIPWLERTVGQDRLVRWHRRIGGWPIGLIAVHIVTITLGYAQIQHSGVVHQFLVFLNQYADVLASLVGFGLLVLAGITSYRPIRRAMRYDTWWTIHLYIYLALGLAFMHQIRNGIMFLGHPLTTEVWVGLCFFTSLLVVLSRFLLPILRNLRFQLRVASVEPVASNVYAVTIRGRKLERLAVSGGQFFQWRFFAKGLLWHSHPYSLSALPRPPFLRLTVKILGDQSVLIKNLKPGTRVFIEGPYGTFTKYAIQSPTVTLIGAGVGATPLRALLEDLPDTVRATVLLRA